MDIIQRVSELDDQQLLAAFVRSGSEQTFAGLVARHVNLVYSTALRFTGNPHHAEEISQAVFIILARKAARLSSRVVLSGWLYQVARLTSANFMKGEIRRQRREQEAYMQSSLNEPQNDGWEEIAPLLDEAMGELGQTDRDAVVLRYFEDKTAAEIGAALRMNEETARKRVNRAIEKLHRYFKRRGISCTTGIIAGAISTHSVHAAPVALVKTITPVALAKGSIATASALTLVKGTLNIMNWTKMKIAISTCTVILLAAGATTLLAQHQSQDAATHGMAYKMLDDACQFCASVDQSKFVVRVLIQPRDKNVRRSDIHLTIKSASKGSIPVQLDDKGQIINFPHDPDLRRENPPVVKEAPKIPLTMILTTYLPEPDGLTFRYSLLGDDLAEVNKAVNTANKMILGSYLGELSPYKHDIEGVIFVFPKASVGKAAVEIASVSGIKKFVADKSGCVRLTLDPVLVTENPEVTLSERPQYIVPNLPHP